MCIRDRSIVERKKNIRFTVFKLAHHTLRITCTDIYKESKVGTEALSCKMNESSLCVWILYTHLATSHLWCTGSWAGYTLKPSPSNELQERRLLAEHSFSTCEICTMCPRCMQCVVLRHVSNIYDNVLNVHSHTHVDSSRTSPFPRDCHIAVSYTHLTLPTIYSV